MSAAADNLSATCRCRTCATSCSCAVRSRMRTSDRSAWTSDLRVNEYTPYADGRMLVTGSGVDRHTLTARTPNSRLSRAFLESLDTVPRGA
jgi:hypothetical protein